MSKPTWAELKTKMKHSISFKYGSTWKLLDQLIEEQKIEEVFRRDSDFTVIIFRQAAREEDYKKLKKKYSIFSRPRNQSGAFI